VYLTLTDWPPTFSALARWLAVGAVLVAVAGRTRTWAAVMAAVIAGLGGLYVAVVAGQGVVGGQAAPWTYVIGGAIVAGVSALQVAGLIRRKLVFDPVVLAAVQLGLGLASRWAYYALSGLGTNPAAYRPETVLSPFRTELPMLALALAAVGLGVSRGWRPAIDRLGVTAPTATHALIAFGVAVVFSGLGIFANYLTYRLMPGTYHNIGEIEYIAYSALPIWAYWLLSALAGTSEETLFRGALQPRFGILITAALFASIHIQYGFTPILAVVFVHGIGLGLLRRYLGTTTAILTHATYDALTFNWRQDLVWLGVLAAIVIVWTPARRASDPSKRLQPPN